MILTKTQVNKVADLAKLTIDDNEIPNYLNDLNNILNLVEQMNNINTRSIEPMAHPFETQQLLRPDEITETNQRDLFQTLAPAVESGLYLVPKVIE